MVIAIIGERCSGKSALAAAIQEKVHAQLFTGRDYLQIDDDPRLARLKFMELLAAKVDSESILIYLVPEHEQLALLPEGCFRVLCKSRLRTIKKRFAQRMEGGQLPQSISAMLDRQHGMFDGCRRHITLDTEDVDPSLLAVEILEMAQQQQQGLLD